MNARVLAWAAAIACAASACVATPAGPGSVDVAEPRYDEFVGGGTNGPGVHTFLEKQCGTLDCHGQIGRPLRLYSVGGLRAENDAGLVSGAGAETSAELYSNFLSIVGLQPEETTRVVTGKDPPTDLLMVQKPTGLVTHKGGIRIVAGDAMYRCLTTWLSADSDFDVAACTQAAALP